MPVASETAAAELPEKGLGITAYGFRVLGLGLRDSAFTV